MGGERVKMSQTSLMSKDSLVKFTILVVDDDTTSLSIVSAMLKSWKYDVVTVKSPVDALATIRTHDIDLVVSDLHMPKMNGLQLQKQIDEEFNLPVIIMSSDDRESVIMKSLSSGVVFYIVKPVSPADVKNLWQYSVGSKKGKSIFTRELGCIEEGSSSKKMSSEDNLTASSVNENKHSKKQSRTKGSKKGKECQGENTVAPKKTKVAWTNSLHNRFLQAIRHISLEKAVPKKILHFMNVPGLTRENVASHLQKYRIFLKRVADKGIDAESKNFCERALRSSFASGHSLLTLRNAQDYAQIREKQQMRTSLFQAAYGGRMSDLNADNFGSTGFSNGGASSSNSVSQVGLLGNPPANVLQSLFGNTIPLYQANHGATYGMGSNNIGTHLLSRGGMSYGPMKDTNSKQMYQQKSQARSDLYNNHNIGASSLNNFGTSGWKPSFTSGYENMGAINNPYSSYAGIRLNDAGELVGIGQTSHNANVLNGCYGLHNGTGNEDLTAGLLGNAAFGYLAPGDQSSSSAFDNTNYQFPPAFAAANKEANPSALSPLSRQQYGLGNNAQNDFSSALMNNTCVFGNIAHPAEQVGEDTDIENLLFGPTDFQLPRQQQQGGESGLNPNFPNSSYQSELNLPANQSQNPDLCIAYGVEDNAPWYEPSLQQLGEIAEVVNPDLGSNAHPLDVYDPNLDQNPNQQQGDENFINSELNNLDQLENSPSENQGWDDEFIASLLDDRPF